MSNKIPEALTPQQIAWMENCGMTLHMALVPKMVTIALNPGDKPHVDPTQVQVVTAIQTGGQHMGDHSDFIPATRGHMNKLLKTKFQIMKDALLDRHFDPEVDDQAE